MNLAGSLGSTLTVYLINQNYFKYLYLNAELERLDILDIFL